MSRLSPVFCFVSASLFAGGAHAQTAPAPRGIVPVNVQSAPDLAPRALQPKSATMTPIRGASSVITAPIPANSQIARPKIQALTASLPDIAPFAIAKSAESVAAPVAVAKSPIEAAAPIFVAPKPLASRNADAQRLMLMRMDADLARAERRLDRAQTRLSNFQRQLGSVTSILQTAMLEVGDAKGLHPFVRVGQRYLGTPYVWGGESGRGFDCSGFIMRVMRDLGYRALPHSAAEQFRYGTPVARELLAPGDIVFFANTYKPGVSHVGIYLGRGRFIHAANSKQGTIVSGINEPKWVAHYAGARRLVRAGS